MKNKLNIDIIKYSKSYGTKKTGPYLIFANNACQK